MAREGQYVELLRVINQNWAQPLLDYCYEKRYNIQQNVGEGEILSHLYFVTNGDSTHVFFMSSYESEEENEVEIFIEDIMSQKQLNLRML